MKAENLQPITNPTTMQQKALMKQQQQATQSNSPKHKETDNKQPDTNDTPKSPKHNPQGIWAEEQPDKHYQKTTKVSDGISKHKLHHPKKQRTIKHSHHDNDQQIWHELDWQARYRDQQNPTVKLVRHKEQAPIGSYNGPITPISSMPAHLPLRIATPRPQHTPRQVPTPPPPPTKHDT